MNRRRQPAFRCYLHSRSQLEIPTSAGYPAVPIEVEQRRIHLRFAWRAFQNEWNIDFPPPGGGGSGSSVTNGGPACEESVVNNNQITSAPQ
jgi:hypothetical protein